MVRKVTLIILVGFAAVAVAAKTLGCDDWGRALEHSMACCPSNENSPTAPSTMDCCKATKPSEPAASYIQCQLKSKLASGQPDTQVNGFHFESDPNLVAGSSVEISPPAESSPGLILLSSTILRL